MILITALIVIILIICFKTLLPDLNCDSPNKGYFDNTVLIDVAGIREHYGITSLASGINYRSDTLNEFNYNDDNDEGSERGSDSGGNFTNRKFPDSRYLEDVMNNNSCWSDVCLKESSSGKVVGKSCDSICSVNPGPGYKRTFGGSKLIYNDDMSDPLFNQVQYKNGAIVVPWSDLYNNIVPNNPSIR